MPIFEETAFSSFWPFFTTAAPPLITNGGPLAQAGLSVTILALSSMVLAAVVLITSNRRLARSALIQGLSPLLGLVFLVLGIATA